MKSTTKTAGPVFLMWIAAAGLLAGSAVAAGANSKNSSAELNEVLRETVITMNKTLPRMLDEEIRFEATSTRNGAFIYHYTLVNYLADEVDGAVVQRQMAKRLRDSVCKGTTMLPFVALRIPIMYVYSGKDRKEITRITVRTAEC